jgi:hypothetical protein
MAGKHRNIKNLLPNLSMKNTDKTVPKPLAILSGIFNKTAAALSL